MRSRALAKTARVVILEQEKILLCRLKGQAGHFLPGWELGYGEKAEATINNRATEDLNSLVKECKYIGAVSHEYRKLNGKNESGFELVYKIELENDANPRDNELIEFIWKDTVLLHEEEILPINLKGHLLAWLENKKVFLAV